MEIKEIYSHKNGLDFIQRKHEAELSEVVSTIESLDAVDCLRKVSSEKTKPSLLFSPLHMNEEIKKKLCPLGWTEKNPNSKKGFREPRIKFGEREFREMDGIKNKVGLEIQFGKYAFMGYDIFSKMPIFAKRGLIECGIEVVVMPSMIRNMSTGVSSFTQIVMDMKNRGVADIDIPTIIIGFECTDQERTDVVAKQKRFTVNREAMIEAGEVGTGLKGAKPGPKLFE